jgi:hypothetical protein
MFGMIQRGQHLRFALQTGHSVGVEGERPREHFERNIPAEVNVVRAIHFAHAAATQQGAQTQVSCEDCAFMEVACRVAIQECVPLCVPRDHSLHLCDQAQVTVTGLFDKARTRGGRKLDGGLEDLADLAKFVRAKNA